MRGLTRFVAIFLIGFAWVIQADAQTLADAQKAYNEAVTQAQEDNFVGAISAVEKCIELCTSVGEEAADLKVMAESKLPEYHFNQGSKLAKEKKNEEAIASFKTAADLAKEYKNTAVADRVTTTLSQLYTNMAYSLLKEKQVEESLSYLDQALALDPNYGTAWYIKCFALRTADDAVNLEKAVDDGIAACVESNDMRNMPKIQKIGRDYFLKKAQTAVAGSNFEEGVAMAEKSIKYDQSFKDTYYYLGTAYNGVENYEKAAEAANKGLALEDGDAEKKAKYYYTLGVALKGQGDKEGACAAFQNALYGPFEENAKYAIEHELKCN